MNQSELESLGLSRTSADDIATHVQSLHDAILTLSVQENSRTLVAGTRFGKVATWE